MSSQPNATSLDPLNTFYSNVKKGCFLPSLCLSTGFAITVIMTLTCASDLRASVTLPIRVLLSRPQTHSAFLPEATLCQAWCCVVLGVSGRDRQVLGFVELTVQRGLAKKRFCGAVRAQQARCNSTPAAPQSLRGPSPPFSVLPPCSHTGAEPWGSGA